MTTITKVVGTNAIHALTSFTFYDPKPSIVEHNTGIDVDNAGRSYDHEKSCDFSDVMWSVLNHVSFHGVCDERITADVEDVQCGATTTRMRWLHIYEPEDVESYGLHYEFIYE